MCDCVVTSCCIMCYSIGWDCKSIEDVVYCESVRNIVIAYLVLCYHSGKCLYFQSVLVYFNLSVTVSRTCSTVVWDVH